LQEEGKSFRLFNAIGETYDNGPGESLRGWAGPDAQRTKPIRHDNSRGAGVRMNGQPGSIHGTMRWRTRRRAAGANLRAWAWWLCFCIVVPATGTVTAADTPLHIVRKGDTLSGIARQYGVSVTELARLNDMALDDILRPGQKLKLPQGAQPADPTPAPKTVVVRKNDNLTLIARAHGVDVLDLALANGLTLDSIIHPGQRLVIPSGPVAAPRPPLPAAVQQAIARAPVQKGRWRYIVIHHSATTSGSPRAMDTYHRQVRRMENGLAYHFVIGNGHGMGDGEIHVGARWRRQLPGGHLSREELNQVSLGICLVGDFNRAKPTRRQMESLEALLQALLERCALTPEAITTHKQLVPGHTECPGKLFSLKSVLRGLESSRPLSPAS